MNRQFYNRFMPGMLKKYTILFLVPVMIFSGCNEDLLDTTPNDRLSSAIFWKTEKDALLAANAVYIYLEGPNIFSWDGMSDIGHTNQNFRIEATIENGQFDALNSKVFNEWNNAYKGIAAANSFLENVEKVTAINQTLIDRLKGEIKTLRAYHYIKLASLYGDVPLITSVISLEESRKITRTPVAQIWDFIAQELSDAATLLPPVQADKGRITKGAALALKARAMLYASRYQEAADAASAVMDLDYSLYPSYENLFTYAAENNVEVILDKQFIKDNYSNNVFAHMAPYSQRASGSYYVPTKKLVDAYQMTNGKDITDPASGFDPYNPYTNRDPRLRYSIYVLGDVLPDGTLYNSKPGSGTADAVGISFIATSTGWNVKKYINSEDLAQPANGGVNIILIRYAEVLLTYAEAKIELNQIDQTVLDAINAIRQRPDVDMPPIINVTAQEELREIVRKERMIELAFEGFRYIDIRRWRIAEEVMPGKIYGMTYEENGTLKTIEPQAAERVFTKSRDYLWPIPQKERELNRQLTQNDNW